MTTSASNQVVSDAVLFTARRFGQSATRAGIYQAPDCSAACPPGAEQGLPVKWVFRKNLEEQRGVHLLVVLPRHFSRQSSNGFPKACRIRRRGGWGARPSGFRAWAALQCLGRHVGGCWAVRLHSEETNRERSNRLSLIATNIT